MRDEMTHPMRPIPERPIPYRHGARTLPERVPAPVIVLCGAGLVALVALAAMVVCGCDGGTDDPVGDTTGDESGDDSGGVQVAHGGRPDRLDADVPVPPPTHGADPCAGYLDPGVTLSAGVQFHGQDVVVFDACQASAPSLVGCWTSDYEFDLGDIVVETGQTELVCEFDCPSDYVTIAVVAGFPTDGTEARLEIGNPCPVVTP